MECGDQKASNTLETRDSGSMISAQIALINTNTIRSYSLKAIINFIEIYNIQLFENCYTQNCHHPHCIVHF